MTETDPAEQIDDEAGYVALARSYQDDPEEQAVRDWMRARRRG